MLGIEAVEWFSEGGETLTVRVTGRWRRRRPAWSGQPTLVIEAQGRRHRFPAMPEPPSLTGAGPGTWRISFAVPIALAPDLGGRAWLQFGSVVVALPGAVEPLGTAEGGEEFGTDLPSPLEPAEEGGLHPASSELETESARRRAKEAEAAAAELSDRVHALEHALAAARREAEELSASLAERERARRAAEQRAHAEQALRRDLGRQLSARSGEGARARQALGDLAAAEERIRELEARLREARRRGDEAEQIAAAAAAARERAERRATEAEHRATEAEDRATEAEHGATEVEHGATEVRDRATAELSRLQFERSLIGRRANAERRVPTEPERGAASDLHPPVHRPAPVPTAAARPTPAAPAPAPELAADTSSALIAALRGELDARAGAEASLRARMIDAEAKLAARVLIERRTATILAELRRELDGLRSAWADERAARTAAEQRAEALAREAGDRRRRSQQAHEAIEELRNALRELQAAADPGQEPPPAPPGQESTPVPPGQESPPAPPGQGTPPTAPGQVVEAERLNFARVRLREAIAPHDPEAEPAPPAAPLPDSPVKPWLAPIFTALARTDPDAAGRLLLELLPAQRAAFAEPVAYDLVLGGHRGCARVTVKDGAPVIRYADGPRPGGEVDFQLLGEPAAIARLLTLGPLRRRLSRGVARVRGRRDRLTALRSLVGVRLDLPGLYQAGVRLPPEMALTLVARMIQPAWTAGERFTLAYAGEAGTWYLLVRDGHPVQVTDEAPGDRIATTITGPAQALTLVLSGQRPESVAVTGEDWPLALLRKWIKRAQSD